MEDIKTNFDKILEQFNDSISHAAPKKLNFDCLNDSFGETLRKKRKLSLEKNDSTLEKSTNDSSLKNTTADSFNSSSISSPWEARRMKADFVEAKARILKLKREIEQQHKVRSEMENLYESKVKELQKQCDFSCNKVLDMEKHLSSIRKREGSAKAELIKIKNQLNQQKQSYEHAIYNLQKENEQIKESSREKENDLSNELNEYKRLAEKLELELELVSEELDNTKSLNNEYKEKAFLYDETKSLLEAEKQQHELSKSKIKELEYELESYGEWKDMSKATHARLTNLPDLERELAKLKQDYKNLRDSVGNKLLLEEQVDDLKSRLKRNEKFNNDAVAVKVKVENLEEELKDWKKIAEDHCPPTATKNPNTLRNRIEQILQKDIILTSEKGNNKNEKDCFQSQIQELQKQNEMYTKNNNELKTALKHHKNIMLRVQKKLMLVAKERDCYKQLVENFEKDLTISNALAEAMNPDSQLRSRLEMLEKTLIAYKDMCGNLERELANLKLLPELPLDLAMFNTENYEHLKKEIETLRIENDRLKRRKEELELEMEHRCLKGDFNVNKFKVVHMTMNPADEAYDNSKNEIEKLQAEIERLKRRIRKLEEDNDEMTTRMNETANMTVNVKEVNTLRAKLESMESKMQHLKDIYKTASLEFREVCYMLFGYKIDRVGNTNYRISSMYAENENEYLNFRLNESGILDMLETEYSGSLGELVQKFLVARNSLPAFLSTLTLELFNKTTICL